MNLNKLITALFLMLPGLSWAQPAPSVPEPSVLALLGVSGIVIGVVALIRRRK